MKPKPRYEEGYRKLLVFQKAEEVQDLSLKISRLIPRGTRALRELSDQMPPSGRSLAKNIAEGWKRRTTNEYVTFLGYAIASNTELMEDAKDIATGLYLELKGIKGVMGETGTRGLTGQEIKGEKEIKGEMGVMGEKEIKGEMGVMGEKGIRGAMGVMGARFTHSAHSTYSTHSSPLSPSAHSPYPSHPAPSSNSDSYWFSKEELDQLKFYPLDPNLPPAVQLYLKCKEVNLLIQRLMGSLDQKMDMELTSTTDSRARKNRQISIQKQKGLEKSLQDSGLVRLIDGRFIAKDKYEELKEQGKQPKLFGQ